jgi:hypothetical protein
VVLSVLWVGLLAGCGGPPHYGLPRNSTPAEFGEAHRLLSLALDGWVAQTARVQRVSQRIRLAGSELCGEKLTAVLGAAVLDLEGVAIELRPIILERYGTPRGLVVVDVFPGMAAERGGLEVGDELSSVNGRRVRRLIDLARARGELGSEFEVEVRRAGEKHALRLPAEVGCPMVARLHRAVWSSDQIQATVNSKGLVRIYSALLRVFPDDESLAVVVGHEFAHEIMTDVLGESTRGVAAEERADYLGSYLAAQAGLLPPAPERVFYLFEQDFNRLGEGSSSHPMTHECTLALRRTAAEIARKQAEGVPLTPEYP